MAGVVRPCPGGDTKRRPTAQDMTRAAAPGGWRSVDSSPMGKAGRGVVGAPASVPASPSLPPRLWEADGETVTTGACALLRPAVVARVRPMRADELAAGLQPEVAVVDGDSVDISPGGEGAPGRRVVRCSAALPGDASNENVYSAFGDLTDALMERLNVTLFAYGETGSGKTHTMAYITDRFIADLLSQARFYDAFRVEMSMVEIENERIYDLACRRGAERPNLSILNYKVKGAHW